MGFGFRAFVLVCISIIALVLLGFGVTGLLLQGIRMEGLKLVVLLQLQGCIFTSNSLSFLRLIEEIVIRSSRTAGFWTVRLGYIIWMVGCAFLCPALRAHHAWGWGANCG